MSSHTVRTTTVNHSRRRSAGILYATILGFVVAASLTGCGGGPKLVPVSGRVTLGGKPLVNATVNFEPAAGQNSVDAGGGSYGRTDADGRYSLKYVADDRAGAVVGEHRVTISSAGEATSDAGGVVDPIPAEYRDGTLRYRVSDSGTDSADFAL